MGRVVCILEQIFYSVRSVYKISDSWALWVKPVIPAPQELVFLSNSEFKANLSNLFKKQKWGDWDCSLMVDYLH